MAVPYNNGKVQIGKHYCEGFKPVVFTRDEEIIQDLLLNNTIPPTQNDLTFVAYVMILVCLVLIGVLVNV
jgi:hypothetical protein